MSSFRKSFIFSIAFLACLNWPSFQIVLAQDKKEADRVLSVSGIGTLQLEPDLAYVRLGVQVKRPSAQEAQRTNAEITSRVLESFQKAGLPKEKVKTAFFNLFPEPEFGRRGENTGKLSYRATNMVIATLEKLDEVGKIIDTGLQAGATHVEGVEFTLKDKSKYEQEAYQKAVAEARRKADAIAAAAGLQIKSIKLISESEGWEPPPHPMSRLTALEASAGGGGVVAAPTPIISGKVELRVTVRIDYTY